MAQDRWRRRRRGRRSGADGAQAARRGRPRWRQTADSFGGFLTIGVVGGALVVVLVLVLGNPLASVSEDALLGEAVRLGPASHVNSEEAMQIVPGEPPTGGPHFLQPLGGGIFDDPVADGNAVHALEHGLVWISYNPDLVGAAGQELLEDVAGDFRHDVILSPRPRNEMAVAAVSWGRILRLDAPDQELLRDFIRTNRDRSPEPGLR